MQRLCNFCQHQNTQLFSSPSDCKKYINPAHQCSLSVVNNVLIDEENLGNTFLLAPTSDALRNEELIKRIVSYESKY